MSRNKSLVVRDPVEAPELLNKGAKALADRASSRDVKKERSMKATVQAFNVMFDKDLTEEQGWMFLVFLKASRSKGGNYREDDYVDGASYFALAGEAANKERV